MSHTIKSTQLTRVGYNYQDLLCIELLIDWYHDKQKYQWVKIESDHSDEGKLTGLDDIVALNENGLYELYQVKFTIDAARDDLSLSFEWLLKSRPKGTSLLQKWFKDVESYAQNNKLAIAELKTNRIPDKAFSHCLVDDKVDITLVPSATLSQIDEQLNGRQNTQLFFEHFKFNHSLEPSDELETRLHDCLVPDSTSEEGWLRFLRVVKRWATRKGVPTAGGHIQYEHLCEILTAGISRTVSQFFEIPPSYQPPSQAFHQTILDKIEAGGCCVVAGAPGMGKSTYLSYLFEHLREADVPVIRHHYSLTSQSTIDRISYPNVAAALMGQLQEIFATSFGDRQFKPEELDNWIKQAGLLAQKSHDSLVVIIDGLDHVWRERTDVSQLEHLVNQLLPLPDGVTLVLGTQPVNDNKLPLRIVSNISREDNWITLPPMELIAIKEWVEGAADVGDIEIPWESENRAREVTEIAEAFLQISSGYPLHLIFSLKSLIQQDKLIRAYKVEKLPICPDGDIHNYYNALWARLSYTAKDILYLMSIVDFPWPDQNSLNICFANNSEFQNAYNQLAHMVECRRSGIFAFHGSILVHVKQKSDYSQAKERLMPVVKKWLETQASPYWQWGWQWLVEANMGNSAPLMGGINRQWLRDSLCTGYPLQHIEHIISSAENVALQEEQYAKLVDLRQIKIRLINGPEYQLQDFSAFVRCALSTGEGDFGINWRADNLRQLDKKAIVLVASLLQSNDSSIVEECIEELERRLQFYANHSFSYNGEKVDGLIDGIISVLSNVDDPDIYRITEFIEDVTPNEAPYKTLFKNLVRSENADYLFDIEMAIIPKGIVGAYAIALVQTACKCEISIASMPQFEIAKSHPFGMCYALIYCNAAISIKPMALVESFKNTSVHYFIDLYFNALACGLNGSNQEVEDPEYIEIYDVASFIQKVNLTIIQSATAAAKKIIQGESVCPFDIYRHLSEAVLPSGTRDMYHSSQSIFSAVAKIASNQHLLLSLKNQTKPINADSLLEVEETEWWLPFLWLKESASLLGDVVSIDFQKALITKLYAKFTNRKELTNDQCNDMLELAVIALELGQLDLVEYGMQQCCRNIVGYGWRKDTTFSELYDAMQVCVDNGIGDIRNWLSRVSQFTAEVETFTEREISHIPAWYIRLVAKYYPERMLDELSYHLSKHNWFLMEDLMAELVKNADFTDPAIQSLAKCLTTTEALQALADRTSTDSDIKSIYDEQITFLGGLPKVCKDSYTNDNDEKPKECIEYKKFAPEELQALLDEFKKRDMFRTENCIVPWIDYWDEQGKGLEIINSYEAIFTNEENFPHHLDDSLDQLFLLSKKLQGKKRAYKWAVRNIRINSYWMRYSGSAAERKLVEYGAIYASKWKRLFIDSTQKEKLKLRGNERGIVPTDKLVRYLVAAGQADLAVEITEVMLTSVEAEIEHLPLDDCYWSQNEPAKDEIGFRMLLTYLQWPDRTVKLRCAQEIAKLLKTDESGKLKALYLKHLSRLHYEVDVVDFIAILQLMDGKIFDHTQLISAIPYHSILTKLLLRELGYNQKPAHCKDRYLKGSLQYQMSDSFQKAMDTGVMPVYVLRMQDLEERVNYPLCAHMAAEWIAISKRIEFLYISPQSFSCGWFYRSKLLSSCLSTNAESTIASAFLRTLAFAADKFSIPDDYIEHHAAVALPFGNVITQLLPNQPPVFWPVINSIKTDKILPSQKELKAFLSKLAQSKKLLLAASGPLSREYKGVSIDLEVYAVSIADEQESNDRYIFDCAALNTAYENMNDIRPFAAKNHPKYARRWEIDKLIRGLFVPTFSITGVDYDESVLENEIQYCEGDYVSCHWRYWHHHWAPVHHGELGSNLGSYLVASKQTSDLLRRELSDTLYLVGRLKILDKRDLFKNEGLQEVFVKTKVNKTVKA